MIELIGVSKRYGSRPTLDGLDLEVPKGEVFGLTGAVGAGKTTTLRIVASLVRADEGSVVVDGLHADRDPRAVRARIGYLPEADACYRRMSLREDLELSAGIHGVVRARRRALAGELLEVVGLADQRDDDVTSLGRGQRRRLGLARTLVHDPPVLLLDEPTAGIDEESQDEVRAVISEVAAMGTTILLTGRLDAELDDLCTARGVLQDGRLAPAAVPVPVPDEEVAHP